MSTAVTMAPGKEPTNEKLNASKGVDLHRPTGSRQFTNNLVTFLVYLAAAIAIVPLVWILWSVITKGLPLLLDPNWWTHDLGRASDRNAHRPGGALHAILGTLEIGLICGLIAVPIAVLGAIYLVEYARGTKAAKAVSFMIDILSGVPSIVAALFIYSLFITIMGQGRSGFAAAVALVLLMLPTVLRSTEEMLKLVPDSLREASYALGVPKWKTILKVVIPTCFSGITTGIVLGFARVMGETAPLLILVAYARNLVVNPMSNTMGTLPTMINTGRDVPEQFIGYERVWGAAMTLILIVMGLNLLARYISSKSKLQEK